MSRYAVIIEIGKDTYYFEGDSPLDVIGKVQAIPGYVDIALSNQEDIREGYQLLLDRFKSCLVIAGTNDKNINESDIENFVKLVSAGTIIILGLACNEEEAKKLKSEYEESEASLQAYQDK